MKSRTLRTLALLTCLAVLATTVRTGVVPAAAQEREPDCPVGAASEDGGWHVPDGTAALARRTVAASPQAAMDSDEFGYTFDDTVPFEWVDTSQGTNTGLSALDRPSVSDAIPLGFDFKFYAGTYSEIYVSTSGAVGFDRASLEGSSTTRFVPSRDAPNNFIAPYLAPLRVNTEYYDGQVIILRGGTAPNRTFVVEWRDAMDTFDDSYTFQLVLREDGDILFQFLEMDRGHYASSVSAIEDEGGLDGLAYLEPGFNDMRETNGTAVLFERPAPAARVDMNPEHQGAFTGPGQFETFELLVRNTGDTGADVYDVELTSDWPVTLTMAGRAGPLTDTDGNGAIDTGEMGEGERATLIVQVASPAVAGPGDGNEVELALRSSLDSAAWDGSVLRSAVPAPFAQAYKDGLYGSLHLDLIRPGRETRLEVAPERDGYVYGAGQMAVAATDEGFVYLWQEHGDVDGLWVSEILYAVYDRQGHLVAGPRKLEDHADAKLSVVDSDPVVAVAPDGRIGVLWQRRRTRPNTWERNYNAYYAVLDSSGTVVVPPAKVSSSAAWESG